MMKVESMKAKGFKKLIAITKWLCSLTKITSTTSMVRMMQVDETSSTPSHRIKLTSRYQAQCQKKVKDTDLTLSTTSEKTSMIRMCQAGTKIRGRLINSSSSRSSLSRVELEKTTMPTSLQRSFRSSQGMTGLVSRHLKVSKRFYPTSKQGKTARLSQAYLSKIRGRIEKEQLQSESRL